MNITLNGHTAYAYTGGRPFDPTRPCIVFIHGALHDHSVWTLLARWCAHHGYSALALDLPGHGRSGGEAPASVEAAAQGVLALLDALGLEQAILVGHSWGALIALEAAAQQPSRVSHAVLVGIAFPMKVSPALLEASQHEPEKAIAMINTFSRATLAAPPSSLGPGTWVYGAGRALNRRILRSNPTVNVFHRGFVACDQYARGLEAMAQVKADVLFILGKVDQMTPPKAAQGLIDAARQRSGPARTEVAMVPMGHHQMHEAAEETLAALKAFLAGR